jgi:hypothetical protein
MKTKPILRKIQRDFPQLDIKDLRIVVGELPPQKYPEESEKNAYSTDQPPTPPEPEDQESSQHKSRFEQALEKLGRQVKDRNDK